MVSITTPSDCTFRIGGYRFGFVDEQYFGFDTTWSITTAYLGPLGQHTSPIGAQASWAVVIIMPFVVAVVAATLFRRRRLLNSARHT